LLALVIVPEVLMVPFSAMLLPARMVTALLVFDKTLPLMVRLSVVAPAPLAPASSHTAFKAFIPPVDPVPPMVSGLLAIIAIFPPVVFERFSFEIQPEVVKAPVLRMLISPNVPLLLASKVLT